VTVGTPNVAPSSDPRPPPSEWPIIQMLDSGYICVTLLYKFWIPEILISQLEVLSVYVCLPCLSDKRDCPLSGHLQDSLDHISILPCGNHTRSTKSSLPENAISFEDDDEHREK
jgi:hypothetical protein